MWCFLVTKMNISKFSEMTSLWPIGVECHNYRTSWNQNNGSQYFFQFSDQIHIWLIMIDFFRFMIGWIMITLVTQWFVIFFESKEVCAKLLNKNDLSDKDFEKRKYIVQTLEDITYENGSIMFFFWKWTTVTML